MAGLFGDNFSPNLGWLGSALQDYTPTAADQPWYSKLGLLFTDPFGKSVPFQGGTASPGPDNSKLGLLFSDPFGERVPFPGAIGARGQNAPGPSTNPADYAGLADAFGGSSAMPPLAAPKTVGTAPVATGPTLDQRTYAAPHPAPRPAPQALPPQAANSMAADMPSASMPRGGFGDTLASVAGILNPQVGAQLTSERNQAITLQAVAQSLVARGYSPQEAIGMARAAAIDPKVAEKILGDAYATPKTMEELIARQAANGQRGGGQGQSPISTYEDFLRAKNRGEKAGTTEGERVANAQLDLPTAVSQANEQLRLVGELRSHPGRNQVGWHDVLGSAPLIPSTKGYDAQKLLDQIKGGAFLEAFKSLKGGGAITEVEGKKATDAIARMDRATSKSEFDRALSDYEGVIKLGVDRANQLAGRAPPNNFQGNSGWQNVGGGVRIRQVQ